MKNPYREGSNYFKLFAQMQKLGTFTRDAIVKFARSGLHLSESAAESSVTVMLSPRAESARGDWRGNISAAGHLYYIEKLGRKTVKGVKEEQRYRLRQRSKPLQPKTRNEVKSKKSKKAPAKKAPAKKVSKKAPAKKAPSPAPATPAPQAQTPAPVTA